MTLPVWLTVAALVSVPLGLAGWAHWVLTHTTVDLTDLHRDLDPRAVPTECDRSGHRFPISGYDRGCAVCGRDHSADTYSADGPRAS